MFSPEEIERYARHIVLHGVGGPGQQKLRAARVLVVGAGGLGSPLIQYLAAAGIGEIGVLDDDEVSLSNLQRQVLHGTADIGRAKVESAKAAIARMNPHVKVTALPARLTADNARRENVDLAGERCYRLYFFPTQFADVAEPLPTKQITCPPGRDHRGRTIKLIERANVQLIEVRVGKKHDVDLGEVEYKLANCRINFHCKHPRPPSESMFGKDQHRKWPGFTPPRRRIIPPLRGLLLLRRVQKELELF